MIRKVARFLGRPTLIVLFLGAVTGIGTFYAEIAFAYAIQAFLLAIDALKANGSEISSWIPHSSLRVVIGFILSLGVARAFLQWAQGYLAEAARQTARGVQYNRLIEWLFHSRAYKASYFSTLTQHAEVLPSLVVALQNLAIHIPTAFLLGCSLFWIAPMPTIYAVGLLGFVGIVIKRLDKSIARYGQLTVDVQERINESLSRNGRNILLVQIYGTSAEERKLRQSCEDHRQFMLQGANLMSLKFVIPQVLGAFLICFLTLLFHSSNTIAPGLVLAYFYLLVRFVQSFSNALRTGADFVYYWPQLRAIAKWWEEHAFDGIRQARSLPKEFNSERPLSNPPGWRLSNLTFRYPDAKRPTFSGLNLVVPPGQTTVLTGQSGAGKTTLLYLLVGYLRPEMGEISILGADNTESVLETIRSRLLPSIGYVGAESFLVDGSIYENLCYGHVQNVCRDKAEEALRGAECHFVFSLPKGMEHRITEQGLGLSAGQKQRLMLARALLREPKVLILDEPSANLDAETELRLVETLAKLKTKMTIVIVTHRQALLTIADQEIHLGESGPSLRKPTLNELSAKTATAWQ
jgi:ABC-type multidrug transport system fused ATPase/permease subunit